MASFKKFYPVSQEDRDARNKAYNKTQSDIDTDVQILREWLKKQPHIPEIKDDAFLEILLLRNKFRVEKTKLKIDKYFAIKTVYADFFKNIDPLDKAIKMSSTRVDECIMPKLTPDGCRVLYAILKHIKDPKDIDFASGMKFLLMRVETQMHLDYTDSVKMILNNEHVTFATAVKMQQSLPEFVKSVKIYFEGFSGRVASVHVVNASPAAEMLFTIVKTVLPAKLTDRIKMYPKNSEKLFDDIPKDCLPPEIGGTGPSVTELSDSFTQITREERDYIVERNKWCSNEKLRLGEPPIDMSMFGVDGTFKKINID